MDILLVTVHDIGNNFGTTIQACALCEFLNKLGYNTKILNYRPSYSYNKGRIGQAIKKILFYRWYSKQKKRYDSYYERHAILTKKYSKITKYTAIEPAKIYMVGSDQVWNPYYACGRDDVYYLKFTDAENKMSYSSSIGQSLEASELNILVQKIQDFKYVAVREKKSVEQLREKNINATLVLDPVFLLDKEKCISRRFNPPYTHFLLIYAVTYDSNLNEIAKWIARTKQLKIVLLGGYTLKYDYDMYYRAAGPNEFMNLINCCDFFICNSFHGTSFAIMFNKQFVSFKSEVSPLRIENILEMFGLEDRLVSDINQADMILRREINYCEVNQRISVYRENSIKYLTTGINELMAGVD